ncbi:CoA transferase subunit A [Streptomyces californicus]
MYGTADHAEYVAKRGEEFWARLAVGEALSGSVDYGRRL